MTTPAQTFMILVHSAWSWACGPTIAMKLTLAVVPAKAGTHARWIPAPRLRGDKLRGNDVWALIFERAKTS